MSNGYIQVDFKGQPTGLKFGMLAVENIASEAQRFSDLHGQVSNVKSAYDMVYWGLANNFYAKNRDIDFTREEVQDWVDDLAATAEGKKVLEDITKTFSESRAVVQLQEPQTKKKTKKSPLVS